MTGFRCLSLATCAAAVLLTGCAVGPDYRVPRLAETKIPERFVAPQGRPAQAEVDLAAWWRSFNDPILTDLVERGLAANLDIDEAGSRVRGARANLKAARGALSPTLEASSSASHAVGGAVQGDRTSFQLGFDAAYEIDLFGGARRSVEAARATAEGSEATLHSVQLTVASEIALNYLDAREAQARLRIVRDTLAALDDTVEIVGWRREAGLVGALDLEQARQLRAETAAAIPTLETSYVEAANRLAVLLGEPPGAVTALLDPARDTPEPPRALPASTPADVIRRRPDVALAERTLAAETARIGVEAAELYPALRLSGVFSGSGASISDAADDLIGTLAAGITAPIFEGGRIRANIEAQKAAAAAAFAAYRSAVLVGLEESENAFAALSAADRREGALRSAEAAAVSAAEIARIRYRAGLIDFQTLLQSERTLLSSQDSLASARVARSTAAVRLYKALGGGWQAAPSPSSASALQRPR